MIPSDISELDARATLLELDRADFEESLYEFYKAAWKYIDPARWMDSWAIDAICLHLQAVVDGEITKLLINCPPRIGKSSLTSVAFPAWTWAQPKLTHTSGAGVPFLFASYSDKLSLRDSVKCRRLIESPWYFSLWGSRFELHSDANTKSRFSNNLGGERLITSIGSGVTGEGGNIICFPRDEVVATEHGYISIGEIVSQKMQIKVWSFNHRAKRMELKPITGWFKNPGSAIVRISLSDGTSFRCTPDHKIWTQRGWVRAIDLNSFDVLPGFPEASHSDCRNCTAIFPSKKGMGFIARPNVLHCLLVQFGVRVMDASSYIIRTTGYVSGGDPALTLSHVVNGACADFIFFCQSDASQVARQNVADRFLREFGQSASLTATRSSVSYHVGSIFCWRSPLKIFEIIIGRIAVQVTRMVTSNAWCPRWLLADKRSAYRDVGMDGKIPTIATKVIEPIPPVARAAQNAFTTAWDVAQDPPITGDVVVGETWERSPLLIEFSGHERETFCLEVEGNHNFFAGYGTTLVSNCIDDPNAANEIESEATTESTLDWWKTTLPTRANNQDLSAIIIIQQRLAENDLTGHVLETEADGWCHLCLPARYEPERSFITTIGWKDPRTEPNQLLWPERLSDDALDRLEKRMGPYVFAGQMMQRPEPAGGGIIKREYWQLWPHKVYPKTISFVLACLDTAYTSEAINDPSGMALWGTFTDSVLEQSASRVIRATGRGTGIGNQVLSDLPEALDNKYDPLGTYDPRGVPKVLLLHAWEERLELHSLVLKVAETCKKWQVDLLLIENKASGISVAQEMRRLFGNSGFGVQLFDPKSQDKVARLISVQHLFAEGLIYAPSEQYPWVEKFIKQVSMFPKGAHDEFVDLTSMGLRYLRDSGLILRAPEYEAEQKERTIYRGRQEPLYSV